VSSGWPLLDLVLGDSLTRLVFFPALAALPLLAFRSTAHRAIKIYALTASLVELALAALYVAGRWGSGVQGGFPEVSDPVLDWIPSYGIRYALTIDGISMPLAALAVALLPLVLLGSWRGIERHWRSFAASLLVLTTGILGALLAFDLFLFYVFWEVMLVPMYFVIGVWGGQRRIYAAVKFFLFTMAGSLLMLVAILWLVWIHHSLTGGWSFALRDLLAVSLPASSQTWLFAAFALAFAIKVPMFPLHTWLPDAHVEAPTGGSVILAGILLKLGTYGFLRFAIPLFPHAAREMAPWLVALAVVGILYGALVAWVQSDMKKLVAYSSVAHLGFVMLGLLAFQILAWEGALLQMVNHGLSTGALFLLVGMLYDRRHTKEFKEYGGIAKTMPWFAFFLVFSTLASVGLPALNGFVGEFLILAGAFQSTVLPLRLAAALGALGVVFAAVYLLKLLAQTLWGPITVEENRSLVDLDWRERLTLLPLCAFMLWIGVAPETFLRPARPALRSTLPAWEAAAAQTPPDAPALAIAPGGAP
jgi:NADH-quinone oxidoreductase subunit M